MQAHDFCYGNECSVDSCVWIQPILPCMCMLPLPHTIVPHSSFLGKDCSFSPGEMYHWERINLPWRAGDFLDKSRRWTHTAESVGRYAVQVQSPKGSSEHWWRTHVSPCIVYATGFLRPERLPQWSVSHSSSFYCSFGPQASFLNRWSYFTEEVCRRRYW